jgi:hypothetical protein
VQVRAAVRTQRPGARAGAASSGRRTTLVAALAALLAALACLAVWPAFGDPVKWTPDGLYYEARLLELRGADRDAALRETFRGPLSAELRARDPGHTGSPAWVRYNEPFYERRVAVPLVGAALYPLAGQRALLYLSLAGYVAAIVALFGLLLLRFRVAVAAAVTVATIFLPPLTHQSSFPLTDSWGLALEIVALGAAVLALERGLRWLPLWTTAVGLLSFTRDSAWIPVLAVAWCALRSRTRTSLALLGTGLAAALPALLLFRAPVRNLLALLVNHSELSDETSWSFIASHYPRAVLDLVHADAGFLRRGGWYTALYLLGGLLALLVLLARRRAHGGTGPLFAAATVLGVAYVLAAPAFSAFRLELVFVPMAAYGLALAAELALSRATEPERTLRRGALRVAVRARRS